MIVIVTLINGIDDNVMIVSCPIALHPPRWKAEVQAGEAFRQADTDGMSADDLAAVEAMIRQDEAEDTAGSDAGDVDGDDVDDMEYDDLLELGEQIGDVRLERWALRSEAYIATLKTREVTEAQVAAEDKCLVCQCEFELGDLGRDMPCSHFFHTECVDPWVRANPSCPTCKHALTGEGVQLFAPGASVLF